MRNDWLSTVLLAILLGALVYLGCEQVLLLRRTVARMEELVTDPGALELKAAWRIGVDGEGKPIIHTVSVIRNSPAETVSAWESRFVETIQADLVTYPPIN